MKRSSTHIRIAGAATIRIIFRATEQWFISMETPMEGGTLRSRALDEIKKVKWDPAWGEERISQHDRHPA